jgi:hypothetical protein
MRHYKIVAYRRAEVSKMLVLGATQDQMAKTLNCSQGVISTDVAYLDAAAAEELKHHIQKKLPHTHLICARGIDQVIRTAWSIVGNAKNEYQKIHALNLIHQCYITKQNLASDGTIINAALEMIKKSKVELKELKEDNNSFVEEATESLTANLQALSFGKGKRLKPLTGTGMSFSDDGSALEEAIVIGASSSVVAASSEDAIKSHPNVGEVVTPDETDSSKESNDRNNVIVICGTKAADDSKNVTEQPQMTTEEDTERSLI